MPFHRSQWKSRAQQDAEQEQRDIAERAGSVSSALPVDSFNAALGPNEPVDNSMQEDTPAAPLQHSTSPLEVSTMPLSQIGEVDNAMQEDVPAAPSQNATFPAVNFSTTTTSQMEPVDNAMHEDVPVAPIQDYNIFIEVSNEDLNEMEAADNAMQEDTLPATTQESTTFPMLQWQPVLTVDDMERENAAMGSNDEHDKAMEDIEGDDGTEEKEDAIPASFLYNTFDKCALSDFVKDFRSSKKDDDDIPCPACAGVTADTEQPQQPFRPSGPSQLSLVDRLYRIWSQPLQHPSLVRQFGESHFDGPIPDRIQHGLRFELGLLQYGELRLLGLLQQEVYNLASTFWLQYQCVRSSASNQVYYEVEEVLPYADDRAFQIKVHNHPPRREVLQMEYWYGPTRRAIEESGVVVTTLGDRENKRNVFLAWNQLLYEGNRITYESRERWCEADADIITWCNQIVPPVY